MQKLLINNVFAKFLPYQVCGQAVAVDSLRNTTVIGETAEQKRARELAAIAAAQKAFEQEQNQLAQRQQEERAVSELQRQTSERVFNTQQSELEAARKQEEQRRLIEANRFTTQQGQQAALSTKSALQLETESRVAEQKRQDAIAKVKADMAASEEMRRKAMMNALPQNTKVEIGNNSVVEKSGFTAAFDKVKDAFRVENEEEVYTLDPKTGDYVNAEGETFAPDEMQRDEKTGKMKPKRKSIFSKWWFWVIIAFVVLGAGFGGWYYVNYASKGKDWSDFMKDIKK